MANDSKAANIVGWMFHGSKKLPITAADLVRFRDKVTQRGDCLLWTASLNHEGYGRFHLGPVDVRAHVLSASIAHGARPFVGALACHAPHWQCGNRNCVAPEHLSWKSPAENIADREADGTTARGPRVNGEQVRAILDLRRGGATFSSIDASLGIHRGAAYDIYHQHSRLRGIREALAAVRSCRVASGSEHDSCESAIVALLPKDVEW